MTIRTTLFLCIAATACEWSTTDARAQDRKRKPNVVLIFVDDMGYADLGCFGAKKIRTPNLDRMAANGIRMTDFYVSQAVCSASRAAILTGCYSNRVSILGALGPRSKHGLARGETTIAEMLRELGYATAIFGKWHLGHLPKHLPQNHGFDEYYGLPYSNDMWPFHPTAKFPDLPLISGKKILGYNTDQTKLTTSYTEKAVDFINRNKNRPFFLYVPHNMPHVPLFVSQRHKGKSKSGLYGDVIEEIDWSVGQILAALKKNGLENDTIVIFTSDNGPWLSYGHHGGSAGPLREGKGTTFEGGVRVSFVAYWPGTIPGGKTCAEPAMTIDLLPTLAKVTGGKLPNHKIDGKNIWPLLSSQKGASSPHEALYFYWARHLQAMRSGKWKLHFPHGYRTMAGRPGGKNGNPAKYSQGKIGFALYDLQNDIGETTNVFERYPTAAGRLQAMADAMRDDLGDSAKKMTGKGVRPPEK